MLWGADSLLRKRPSGTAAGIHATAVENPLAASLRGLTWRRCGSLRTVRARVGSLVDQTKIAHKLDLLRRGSLDFLRGLRLCRRELFRAHFLISASAHSFVTRRTSLAPYSFHVLHRKVRVDQFSGVLALGVLHRFLRRVLNCVTLADIQLRDPKPDDCFLVLELPAFNGLRHCFGNRPRDLATLVFVGVAFGAGVGVRSHL